MKKFLICLCATIDGIIGCFFNYDGGEYLHLQSQETD